MIQTVVPHSLFTEYDIHLFKAGHHYKLYNYFGSHLCEVDGQKGCYFAVWAPNAKNVAVGGNFNNWRTSQYRLNLRWDKSGIWEGFIAGVKEGDLYKYFIVTQDDSILEKGDPYAYRWEVPPSTASVVWSLDKYRWQDDAWAAHRRKTMNQPRPYATYEVHLGSWRKPEKRETSFLTYNQLREELVPYVKQLGFTHVEIMPVMEHPYYPSWGYQIIGYYAATSRFGTPEELMALVDAFHQEGIGVILDWVPSHFPSDGHSLSYFDGTHLYEDPNPQRGYHPDWKSLIFNYGRPEVKSFLISNALFWCEMFHADGLRVDAVSSLLHLNFSRKDGEWTPNKFGGVENLEAIEFIKEMNQALHAYFPDVQTIAEESTAYPLVTKPVHEGGLGFDYKWMMGWMHDTLKYFALDPINKKFHHDQITFSTVYAWSERFVLPFSHDEVVHGKSSLVLKMPGNEFEKFANLRILFGYMFTHPGAKLLFMGAEFGQTWEWSHINGLEWELLRYPFHQKTDAWTRAILQLYRDEPALYEKDHQHDGFEWLIGDDRDNSVLVYLRKGFSTDEQILVILNFTPVERPNYGIGVRTDHSWKQLINSQEIQWGGDQKANTKVLKTSREIKHDKPYTLTLTIPPLSVTIYKQVKKTASSSKPKVKSVKK